MGIKRLRKIKMRGQVSGLGLSSGYRLIKVSRGLGLRGVQSLGPSYKRSRDEKHGSRPLRHSNRYLMWGGSNENSSPDPKPEATSYKSISVKL